MNIAFLCEDDTLHVHTVLNGLFHDHSNGEIRLRLSAAFEESTRVQFGSLGKQITIDRTRSESSMSTMSVFLDSTSGNRTSTISDLLSFRCTNSRSKASSGGNKMSGTQALQFRY